ncbi:MAG: serine protease [Candidatus Obscuribacterales bacterium]|nr:serine protease [Candidatus Obscuribacterales bacterium]
MLERSTELNSDSRSSSGVTADRILFDSSAFKVLGSRNGSDTTGQSSDGWLFVSQLKADSPSQDSSESRQKTDSAPKEENSSDAGPRDDKEKTDKKAEESVKKDTDSKTTEKEESVEIPSLILGKDAKEDTVKKYPKEGVIAKTYDKVAPSVVKIEATRPGAIKGISETSFGTGFFVAENGVIATNDHVFNGFDEIKIKTADGKEYKAKVLAEDKVNDIALLKITPDEGKKYAPLELEADSKAIAMQQKLMILGHAKGWEKTYLSEGEVVGATTVGKVEPKPNPPEENPNKRVVAIKAHGEDGGSGGPVVNEKGKVTGIAELASDSTRGQHVFMTLVEPLNALIDKTLNKKK